MIYRTHFMTAFTAAAAFALPVFVGCSTQPAQNQPAAQKKSADEEHGKPLTEDDVKMPASFAAGVARLNELQQKINQLIQGNQLEDVHHIAEEMGILARKMKTLAARDIPADKQAEAGRLCNDIAGYFSPIDEAADAGKKDETMAIHMKMVDTVGKLQALSKK